MQGCLLTGARSPWAPYLRAQATKFLKELSERAPNLSQGDSSSLSCKFDPSWRLNEQCLETMAAKQIPQRNDSLTFKRGLSLCYLVVRSVGRLGHNGDVCTIVRTRISLCRTWVKFIKHS